MCELEALPGPGLMRRVLVPALLGETLFYWQLPVRGGWAQRGHRILGAVSLRAGPVSAPLPRDVCGEGPSHPIPDIPFD